MEFIIALFVFLTGAIIGSFLNVCIYRIPKEESIAYPPSHCSSCDHKLGFWDLFPIFSYLFLKGRCRYCNSKVSIQYPIVEALTGIVFLIIYFNFGLSVEMLKYCLLSALLIVIGIIDFKTQDIYTSTIRFGGILGVVFIVIEYYNGGLSPIDYIAGAISTALILSIFAYFNAMGWGDVELVFIIGLFLGLKLSLLQLFISIVIGGIFAIGIMIFKKREKYSQMAFGNFIAIGSFITIIWGNKILDWYFNFIL